MSDKNTTLIVVKITTKTSVPLGAILVTAGAVDLLDRAGVNISALLRRHQNGDWGEIDSDDWAANNVALTSGGRVLSRYGIGQAGERLWIITEWDRSATTVLLPEEY
jgi:hypothetical protein